MFRQFRKPFMKERNGEAKKIARIMHLIKSIFAIFSEILHQTIKKIERKKKNLFKEWTKGKKTTTIVSQ